MVTIAEAFRRRERMQKKLHTSRREAIDQSSCNNEKDGEYGIQWESNDTWNPYPYDYVQDACGRKRPSWSSDTNLQEFRERDLIEKRKIPCKRYKEK